MQFIDIAITSLSIASVGFFAVQFVAGLMNRRRISPGQLSLLDEQLQPIWDECSSDDEQWLDEVKPIAIPDGVFCCDADPIDAALVDSYIQSRRVQATHNVVPFIRPVKRTAQAIDWNSLTPYQLRSECQKRGIRWRNAHGKNRHMTKMQMVEALSRTAAA